MTGKRGHAHGDTPMPALPRLGVRQRRTCSIYDPSRERGPDHLSAARNRGYAKVSPRRTPKSHLQLRFGLSGSSTGGFPICVRVDGPTLGMDSGSGAGMTEKRRHAHGRSVFSGLLLRRTDSPTPLSATVDPSTGSGRTDSPPHLFLELGRAYLQIVEGDGVFSGDHSLGGLGEGGEGLFELTQGLGHGV